MQTNNETKTTIHIKVSLNEEFRRLSLDNANFGLLESTIRNVFSVPNTEKIQICYIDEEQDKVIISSDQDFVYALELLKQPLKLLVTLTTSSSTPVDLPNLSNSTLYPEVSGECSEIPPPSDHARGCGRGRGRGRGRQCRDWLEGKDKWKEEKSLLTPEQIKERKIEKISERIQKIESLLVTELPAQRERNLGLKLEKLKDKLELLKTETPAKKVEPRAEKSEPCGEDGPRRGGRGRGRGRGGCKGQARGCKNEDVLTPGGIDEKVLENLRTARRNLREAHESGDDEEVKKCTLALDEAKFEKKEAKRKLKGEKPNQSQKPLWAEKNRQRECIKNLRDAKITGDKSKISECESALIEAKEALMKAKLEFKC